MQRRCRGRWRSREAREHTRGSPQIGLDPDEVPDYYHRADINIWVCKLFFFHKVELWLMAALTLRRSTVIFDRFVV